MKFYVYAYLDPRRPGYYSYDGVSFEFEPFYIGKGSNGRSLVHLNDAIRLKNSTSHKLNRIRSIRSNGLEPLVIKIQENLEEKVALELETDLIEKIGRRDLKTGPLTNKYDRRFGISEETRLNLKISFSGSNNPRFGKKHTLESRLSMSRTKRILIDCGLLKYQGNPSIFKGKTYEELFGKDKALELKKSRREVAIKNKLGEGGRKSESYSIEERFAKSKRLWLPVEVDGIQYESFTIACERLGISLYKLHKHHSVKRLKEKQG